VNTAAGTYDCAGKRKRDENKGREGSSISKTGQVFARRGSGTRVRFISWHFPSLGPFLVVVVVLLLLRIPYPCSCPALPSYMRQYRRISPYLPGSGLPLQKVMTSFAAHPRRIPASSLETEED